MVQWINIKIYTQQTNKNSNLNNYINKVIIKAVLTFTSVVTTSKMDF